MRAVAASEVVVPQARRRRRDRSAGRLDLAAGHRAGRHVVRAGVHLGDHDGRRGPGHRGRRVSVAPPSSGANWPSDDLWLAVNPGTEDGLTLPPDAVRSLPIYTDGPTA